MPTTGTVLSAAQRDEPLRLVRDLVRELARLGAGELDAAIAHHLHHPRVNAGTRLGARRNGVRPRRVREAVEQGGGDLRAPGVVHAGEEHGGHGAGAASVF